MDEPLGDQILNTLDQARHQYYRLILVVAPPGSGKTSALHHVSDAISAPLINLNLELSRRMLNLTERQRILDLARILQEIASEVAGEVVLLDNIELLFDVNLKRDPLRLLQKLSRDKIIVAAWSGCVMDGHLTYASPGHPEHRHYPAQDILICQPGSDSTGSGNPFNKRGHGE